MNKIRFDILKSVLARHSSPVAMPRLMEALRELGFEKITEKELAKELEFARCNGRVWQRPVNGRDAIGWMLVPPRTPAPEEQARPVAHVADKLYPWQRDALRAWEHHHYRGIVEAVTGSGKTIVALAAWERLRAKQRRLNTLVVVPTIELMNQWQKRFEQEFPNRQIGRVGGGHHSDFSTTPICVAVINSAVNHLERLFAHLGRCEMRTLLIADECHRYVDPIVFSRIRHFPFTYTLGLSATIDPFQVQGLGQVIYTYRFADAVRDGLVPRFDLVNASVELTRGERAEYDELTEKVGDQSRYVGEVFGASLSGLSGKAYWRKLQALLKRPDGSDEPSIVRLFGLLFKRSAISYTASRKLALAKELVLTLLNEGRRKLIVFFERIRSAEELQDEMGNTALDHETARSLQDAVLAAGSNWCRVLHSGLGRTERHAVLEEFKTTKAAALVTCRVLDEGLDVPEIDAAVLVASTQSERQRIQRVGRSLRKGDGNKRPIIVTLYVPETTDVNVTATDEETFRDAAVIHQTDERTCLNRVRELLACKQGKPGE